MMSKGGIYGVLVVLFVLISDVPFMVYYNLIVYLFPLRKEYFAHYELTVALGNN